MNGPLSVGCFLLHTIYHFIICCKLSVTLYLLVSICYMLSAIWCFLLVITPTKLLYNLSCSRVWNENDSNINNKITKTTTTTTAIITKTTTTTTTFITTTITFITTTTIAAATTTTITTATIIITTLTTKTPIKTTIFTSLGEF